MSIATMIIGESGTGKSASLRNLDPTQCLLIQAVKKPLPFRSKAWSYRTKDNPSGNVWVCDDVNKIVQVMHKVETKIIIIDDFQYILANEFMRRSEERGFDKFTDIGRHAWDLLMASSQLCYECRVYIMAHSDTNDAGKTKAKTIGKLLDDKITIEGLLTIVLKTQVINGGYFFSTRNNGNDTTKTPMGMFEDDFIENDLNAVDQAICDYYEINTNQTGE
jgi:hypothetical protein